MVRPTPRRAAPPPPRRSSVYVRLMIPILVLSLLGVGVFLLASKGKATPSLHHAHRAPRPPGKVTRVLPDHPWTSALGVYAGPGAAGEAQGFALQEGSRVPYALDFFDASTWDSISDPTWILQRWSTASFHMIFGVPMLPNQGASLALGATGSYNSEFSALSTHLVAAGDGSAILMLGWDPLQAGTTWQVHNQAQATQYVDYWRTIVTTMRAVPGATFSFEWNGGDPVDGPSPGAVYPGDSFVDLVATNTFDALASPSGESRWASIAGADHGPDWFSQFAAQHGKPLAIAEWGLVPRTTTGGGGDDPTFVVDLTTWCQEHKVAFFVAWDYGTWAIGAPPFPAAAATLAHRQAAAGSPTDLNSLQAGGPSTT
jgi:hypothetical protein